MQEVPTEEEPSVENLVKTLGPAAFGLVHIEISRTWQLLRWAVMSVISVPCYQLLGFRIGREHHNRVSIARRTAMRADRKKMDRESTNSMVESIQSRTDVSVPDARFLCTESDRRKRSCFENQMSSKRSNSSERSTELVAVEEVFSTEFRPD